MPTSKIDKTTKILIAVLALIILTRLLSLGMYPVFDPTEGRYAEIGRKMLETGNWVTPFIEYGVPFWAKPPLSFWLTTISYKIFGISEFTARLPSFLCMMVELFLVFGFYKKFCQLQNSGTDARNEGLTAAIVFSSMSLFFYLAGGVMTDPSLSLGITLTMIAFWRAVVWKDKYWDWAFFAGVSISLLAKGPIGIVLPGMPIFIWLCIQNKWRDMWYNIPWIRGTLATILVVLPWYIMAEIRTPGFLNYFIVGEHFHRFIDSGWKGDLYGGGRARPIGTIWLYALLCTLPWSLLLFYPPFLKKLKKSFTARNLKNEWNLYLLLWALLPLIFFTFARNILATYVAASLPAIALLLTSYVRTWPDNKKTIYALTAMGSFIPLLFAVAVVIVKITPDASWIKSEKETVLTYQELAKGSDDLLIYVPKRPYSANFYDRGESVVVKGNTELEPYLNSNIYVAMPKGYYPSLSLEIKKKLEIVAQKNDSILLRTIR